MSSLSPASLSVSAAAVPAWRPLPAQARYAPRHADAAVNAFVRGLQLERESRGR